MINEQINIAIDPWSVLLSPRMLKIYKDILNEVGSTIEDFIPLGKEDHMLN